MTNAGKRFASAIKFFKHPDRRNFLVYALGAFFLKGVSFFLIPMYTNLLTAGEFGSYDLLRTFGSVIEIIFSLGLLQLLYVEFFDKNNHSKAKFIATFISIYLVIATVLYLITAVAMLFFTDTMFPGIRYNLVLIVLITTYLNFFQVMLVTVLKLSFKAVRVSVLQVTLGCTSLLLNIILVYGLKKGIDGILISSLAITVLSCFYGVFVFRKQLSEFRITLNKQEFIRYLRMGMPFIPNVLSFWVMNSANRFILLNYSGLNEVGIYSVAARITGVFEPLLIEPFLSAYMPALLQKFKSGNYNQSFLLRTLLVPVAFIIPGFLLMAAGNLVIGPGFAESVHLIVPLSVAYAFNLLAQSSGLILIHRKRINIMLYCVMTGSVVSVAVNFMLVPSMGATGSMVAAIAGNVVWAALITYLAKMEFRHIRNELSSN